MDSENLVSQTDYLEGHIEALEKEVAGLKQGNEILAKKYDEYYQLAEELTCKVETRDEEIAALEAENEELKESYKSLTSMFEGLTEKYNELRPYVELGELVITTYQESTQDTICILDNRLIEKIEQIINDQGK